MKTVLQHVRWFIVSVLFFPACQKWLKGFISLSHFWRARFYFFKSFLARKGFISLNHFWRARKLILKKKQDEL